MAQDVYGRDAHNEDFNPVNELSYEQARDELTEVVKLLERGQMGLDESLRQWERGEELSRYCEEKLAGAQERIQAALAAAEEHNED